MKKIYSFILAVIMIQTAIAQVADFTYAGSNGKCKSETWNFTNTSTGATSYIWYFGDGNVSTQTNPSHTYSSGGNYIVKLVASNGSTTHTKTVAIMVRSNPSANFNVSNFGSAKLNQVINFTNYSNHAYRYHWDFDDGSTTTSRHTKHAYTSSGLKNVTLTAYDNCGDSSISTQQVMVEDTATASPSASGSVNQYIACPGAVLEFYNYSNNATQAKWIFGDGNEKMAIDYTTEYVYMNKGNYKVKLVAYSGTKTDTATFDILISDTAIDNNLVQSAQVSPYRYHNNVLGYFTCPGKKFTLRGSYSAAVSKHYWKVNGTNNNIKDTNVTYTSTGDYEVWYIVENACGVKDSTMFTLRVRDNATFATYPVNIMTTPSSSTICPGNKIRLSSDYSVTDSNELRWILHDQSMINYKLSIEQTYANAGTYTVKLIRKPECGLDDTSDVTIQVNNNAMPPAYFYVSGMNPGRENCVGDSISVSPDSWSGADYTLNPVTHKWYMGDGTTYTTTTAQHKYSAPGYYSILHETTNSCGNKNYEAATIYAATNVFPSPQFYGNPIQICEDDSVMFDNFTSDADSFGYDFGDGIRVGDKSHFPHMFHAYTSAGVFKARLYAYNGCGVDSAEWTTTVLAKPNGQILMNDTAIAPNTSLTFTRNTSGTTRHLWRFGTDTSSANTFTRNFPTIGNYRLYLYSYNENGCLTIDSILVEVKINIAIDEVGNSARVNVYPNPVQQHMNFAIALTEKATVAAYLYDINGRMVKQIPSVLLEKGEHVLQSDLSGLNRGIYILHVSVNNNLVRYKLIKD